MTLPTQHGHPTRHQKSNPAGQNFPLHKVMVVPRTHRRIQGPKETRPESVPEETQPPPPNPRHVPRSESEIRKSLRGNQGVPLERISRER